MGQRRGREQHHAMPGGLHIANIAGIPLIIHYSWLAIFALVTVNLTIVFNQPPFNLDWTLTERVIVALITSLLFFGSVLVHELAHSLLSIRYGYPVHNITLFIFGGASHIAQEAEKPSHEAAIAFVGPLTSFILGALFYGVSILAGTAIEHVAVATWWLAIINVFLGLFNLLPGFPLDGGRVLRATVWAATKNLDRATKVASGAGRAIGFGLMIAGGLQIVLQGNLAGLWLVLIGWFLENAASSSYVQMQMSGALSGVTAKDVMDTDCTRVPQQLRLDTLVEGYILPTGKRCFIVTGPSGETGIITLGGISSVPRDRWREASVSDAMVPMPEIISARPDTPAADLLNVMTERNINQVPIILNGEIAGMATRERMLSLLRMRSEIGMDGRSRQ